MKTIQFNFSHSLKKYSAIIETNITSDELKNEYVYAEFTPIHDKLIKLIKETFQKNSIYSQISKSSLSI